MGLLFSIIWILLTTLIEVAVAKFMCGYKVKKQLWIIAKVNFIAHLILGLLFYYIINSLTEGGGALGLLSLYVSGGVVECGIEAKIYIAYIDKLSENPVPNKSWIISDVVLANVASYFVGFFAAIAFICLAT